jgi:hypothetical protein
VKWYLREKFKDNFHYLSLKVFGDGKTSKNVEV